MLNANYQIVSGSEGQKISFAITVGTQEGYGPSGIQHTQEEVVEAALAWMKGRAEQGLPFLTGTATPGTVMYAYPTGPGTAGTGQESNSTVGGELSHLYNQAFVQDLELAKETLNDFAAFLGGALGQTRVYVALGDQNWVLQAEKKETPTGE